ncbi:uncharacterized protein LOC119079412 [Bradysia coprophila]|uniref:uncharacterized protein LOC119079412 n=1 Tax=Bradysia coprophila TaxID=38358 RepID=UPI00187D9BCE|nr:uncharacterized protein LOC119079412 [Bradysia coprophila]XP_037043209.1 uncharacterized protein LOC119079412 [Bradysia coprophila]
MSCIPLIMTLLFMGLTLVHSDSPEVNVADGLNDEVETFDGAKMALKPLDQVPGVNLFFNLPYKWFDETKPGCFVSWFSEYFNGISTTTKQVAVMCNRDDQKWYNETDSDWIIERPGGVGRGLQGHIILRNVKTKQAIERVWSTDKTWLGVGGYHNLDKSNEHMWMFMPDPNDKNRFSLWHTDYETTQYPYPNHRGAMYLIAEKDYKDGYPYSLSPSIALELKTKDFEFQPFEEELEEHASPKALIDEFTIDNDSPATVSRKLEVAETVTDEFSYGFSQSIKNAIKITGSVGIPLVAEGKVEATFEVGLGANQNWKTSTDKTIKMSYTVNVPEHSEIKISGWYDLIKDLNMDFTATVEVSGKTQRVNHIDEIVHNVPAPGDMIRKQLENSGFEGDILETKSDCVIVRVKGKMAVTAGVRGRLDINGETVQNMEPV